MNTVNASASKSAWISFEGGKEVNDYEVQRNAEIQSLSKEFQNSQGIPFEDFDMRKEVTAKDASLEGLKKIVLSLVESVSLSDEVKKIYEHSIDGLVKTLFELDNSQTLSPVKVDIIHVHLSHFLNENMRLK